MSDLRLPPSALYPQVAINQSSQICFVFNTPGQRPSGLGKTGSAIEQLLRGVYSAFRNPRAHEKITDTQDDADSIIVFIDYLLKVIDQSKTPFSKVAFIPRIFDSDFVVGEKYSDLLGVR